MRWRRLVSAALAVALAGCGERPPVVEPPVVTVASATQAVPSPGQASPAAEPEVWEPEEEEPVWEPPPPPPPLPPPPPPVPSRNPVPAPPPIVPAGSEVGADLPFIIVPLGSVGVPGGVLVEFGERVVQAQPRPIDPPSAPGPSFRRTGVQPGAGPTGGADSEAGWLFRPYPGIEAWSVPPRPGSCGILGSVMGPRTTGALPPWLQAPIHLRDHLALRRAGLPPLELVERHLAELLERWRPPEGFSYPVLDLRQLPRPVRSWAGGLPVRQVRFAVVTRGNLLEDRAWSAQRAHAEAAFAFWSSWLGLVGEDGRPLDAAARARWLRLVRAVSWVESRHGTAGRNQPRRDPMQCGNPRDAWFRVLTSGPGIGKDRLFGGPGRPDRWAGQLASLLPGAWSHLRPPSAGHQSPAWTPAMSYFWGVPYLIHRVNLRLHKRTWRCGPSDWEALLRAAPAYNGGGDPAYARKLQASVGLIGGQVVAVGLGTLEMVDGVVRLRVP